MAHITRRLVAIPALGLAASIALAPAALAQEDPSQSNSRRTGTGKTKPLDAPTAGRPGSRLPWESIESYEKGQTTMGADLDPMGTSSVVGYAYDDPSLEEAGQVLADQVEALVWLHRQLPAPAGVLFHAGRRANS